jgi:hypothetical protein
MFEHKEQAEAGVLAVEAAGSIIDTDLHGVDWEHGSTSWKCARQASGPSGWRQEDY